MTLKRLPFFELSIVVVMVILGWAAFWLHNEEGVVQVQSIKLKDLKEKSNVLLVEANAIQQVFTNLQEAFKGELSPEQTNRMENMLKLAETLQIKEEYYSIADHLESGVSNMHAVLSDGVNRKSRTLSEGFGPQRRKWEDWLEKEKYNLEAGRLPARCQNLRERIDKERLSSTNGPVSITTDLGTLLKDIDRAYAKYQTGAAEVLQNAALTPNHTPRWDFARDRLQQAGNSAKELSDLAQQARADGKAVESFLESQWQSESNKREWRQEKALTLLTNSQSALEFTKQAGISSQAGGPGDSNSEVTDPSLRPVRYGLLIALGGLGVFLMVAIYRRMVVAPLRLKLVESDTIIEQQNKLAHFGELAAGLAHEIGNPLTAIGARLYTLQKGLAEGSPEFQDASVIRNEIRRLDRIVQDFRSLARPAEPKLVPISAEPLLKKTLELLAPLFETQSVQLTPGPIAEGQFRGDEEQLKQVLINLIQNAADSMEGKGGPIVLRARKDRAKLKGRETDAIIIEVEDAGPGIPPEIQERLFDPFFSTKTHGTGLGLAIAARIVDKHGGALTFDTHLNRGTTFGIVLPLYDKAP